MPTRSTEDYLKAILTLGEEHDGPVSTTALAERLDSRPASITGKLRHLSDAGWIDYTAYKGAFLTSKGRTVALNILRRHRLWEVFLVDKLGFGWDAIHDIAEQLEHVESNALLDRLDDYLGHPRFDPHGDPIPTSRGEILDGRGLKRLSEVAVGSSVVVKGVVDSSDPFLQHLGLLGIVLGIRVELLDRLPFDGSVIVRKAIEGKGGENTTWTRPVADNLLVETKDDNK